MMKWKSNFKTEIEKKLKKHLLKFYIKHCEKYTDGPKPIGTLKLFVCRDEYDIFKRDEDRRFFVRFKNGKDSERWREVIVVDEYPNFNIYDVSFTDIETRCSAPLRGKVEGKDKFFYFNYLTQKT